MQEDWLWNIADENSPLGNDTGADALAAFREWRPRHRGADPVRVLASLLSGWEVPDRDWGLLDPLALQAALPKRHFEILTRDDTAIAVAQLVEEGIVSPALRDKALLALQRQADPIVVHFRGWVDPGERQRRLRTMRSVIEQATRT
jgi:uncharacterized protein YfeS